MINHIILGLGGTGGNIILAFRKTVWVEHRNLEPRHWDDKRKEWGDPAVNLGYLYVDSNDQELNHSDGGWQWLGQSLALGQDERLLIGDANMGTAIDNFRQRAGSWIGDPEILRPMIQTSRSLEGANQIRRFGRYLFAQSVNAFQDQVVKLVERLGTQSGKGEATFHICCTLGCGTGSGSVIDVISQIRKKYPDTKLYPIYLYCLVTDENVQRDVGFFYPNQYAALTELNALRQCKWAPYDILAGEEAGLKGVKDQFQCCFLVSPRNEKSEVVSKKEQEDMIAAYIYQKVVGLKDNVPACLQKAESFEDIKAQSPDESRCWRFASIGIKRFRIPEEEIREKLSYTFALQAVLQSLFDNWPTNTLHGYIKGAVNRNLPELVTNPEKNERWCLTDDHLEMSTDFVLKGGKSWPSIFNEWKSTLEGKKESLLKFKNANRRDREAWFNEMLTFAQAFFDKNFRDRGVLDFYRDRREAIQDYAREIRRRIETDLFDRWKIGTDSVADAERILDALIKHLEGRKGKFDQRTSEARKQEKMASERMREAETRWHGVGLLTEWLTSKQSQLLGSFTGSLIDKHVALTEVAACAFAQELVQQVLNQLAETRSNLMKVTALLTKIAEDYEKKINERIRGDEHSNYNAKEVWLAEPKQIDETIKALQRDFKVQQAQCAGARAAIASSLGAAAEEQTFSSLAKKMNADLLNRIVFHACDEAAEISHTALFKGPTGLKRILGRNIVEKLYEDHGDITPELNNNIKSLVESASAYMKINKEQEQPLKGTNMPRMPQKRLVVFIPEARDIEDFRGKLKKAFTAAVSASEGIEAFVEDNHHSPNEILLISIYFWFELRFMLPLIGLRERYEEFVRRDELKGVHQIHLENQRAYIKGLPRGPGIGELPSLYPPEYGADDFETYLLLGCAIGYVRPEEDARGIQALHYARRDSEGMALSNQIDLRSLDLTEAARQMTNSEFRTVKADLDQELRRSYEHVDKKRTIREMLDAMRKTKFRERGQKNGDPVFRAFSARVEDAKNIVDQA
jgi:hypothetical protein